MSKNTSSDQFRKVNVDVYDEDQFTDAEVDATVAVEGLSQKENDVGNALNSKDYETAVKLAISNPPNGATNDIKDRVYRVVADVVQRCPKKDIPEIVKSFDSDQVGIMMKYVYRGMAAPEDDLSAVLLLWHSSLVESGGIGCVMRVLTDRHTV